MKNNIKNLYIGVKEFVEKLESSSSKPLYELTPEEARNFLVDIQRQDYEEIPADIWDTQIMTTLDGNVQLRFIRPENTKGEKLPLIIYCHGGGWIMGDKYTHDYLVRKLANELHVSVAFIDYPRSPEEKYPTALNQIYAALDFLFNSPNEYDIDTEKIILAGDSAGANMALSTAIRAKKENGVKIQFLLLMYPAIDFNMESDSYREFENGPYLTKKAMKWFWNAYMSCEDDKKDVYFSPFYSDMEDLKGLPQTLIITAENDVLRDEGEKLALKLNEAGVQCSCVRILGTIHDFMMLNSLKDTKPTKTAFNTIKCVLNEILKR